MSKMNSKLSCAFGLFLSALFIISLTNVGMADPIGWGGYVPPPSGTDPPRITMFSLNNTVFTTNNISLAFNVSIPKGNFWYLSYIWYVVDWQKGNNSVYNGFETWRASYFFNKTLNGVPEGNHTVTVFATGQGNIKNETAGAYFTFEVIQSSPVNFIVDTIPPTVSFLSAENATYDANNVTLSFSVNKLVSQIVYSLDNQGNVTNDGNTTLTLSNLSYGGHNVTVYAQDDAGLVGASNTFRFNVTQPVWPEPSVAVMIISVVGASAVIAMVAGLFVYFKKRMPLGKS
jgi:hypothetical protein